MIYRILWVVLLTLALSCRYNAEPPLIVFTQKSSAPWQAECSVRPVVIRGAGASLWTDELIQTRFDFAAKMFWKKVNLKLNLLPTEYLDDGRFQDIDSMEERYALADVCRAYSAKGELAIIFCNWIHGENIRGYGRQPHGGESFMPYSKTPRLRYGIFIAYDSSSQAVVGHELGHAFGLEHYGSPFECDFEPIACNVMSYCDQRTWPQCEDKLLNPRQIDLIRYWASVEPRNEVVRILSPGELKYPTSSRPASPISSFTSTTAP